MNKNTVNRDYYGTPGAIMVQANFSFVQYSFELFKCVACYVLFVFNISENVHKEYNL